MNRDGFDVNDGNGSRNASNTGDGASSQSPTREPADELRFLQQQRHQLETLLLLEQRRNETPVGRFRSPIPPLHSSSRSIPFLSTAQKASQVTASALTGSLLSSHLFVAGANRHGFMQRPAPSPGLGTYYDSPSRPAYLQKRTTPNASANPAKLSPTPPRGEQGLQQDEMKVSDDQQKQRAKSYDFPLPPIRGEARRIAPPKLESYYKLWNSTMNHQSSNVHEQQHRLDTFRIKMSSGQVDMEQDTSITGRHRRGVRGNKRQRRDHSQDTVARNKKQRHNLL